MPNKNFTIPAMYPLLERGEKTVTIRPPRDSTKVGDTLHVWVGNRFKKPPHPNAQRKLGTAKVECVYEMIFQHVPVGYGIDCKVLIKTGDDFHECDESELLDISKRDGFDTIRDFIMYHTKNLDEFGRKTYIQFGAQSWLK